MESQAAGGELVAALRADMVGSTELLAQRGIDAAIAARRQASALVERWSGTARVLATSGDGTVVGFNSATQAIAAAWNLQAEVRATADFELRVAVSLEEVPLDGSLGGLVEHRTQLIESQCPPGSVVTDGRICRAVRSHGHPVLEARAADLYELTELGMAPAQSSATTSVRALLFCDLAIHDGFEATEAALVASAISARSITDNGGVVLDANGAGHLASFGSCADALRAAESMHAEAASTRARADVPGGLAFRVGLSVGEIVTVGPDCFGLAVVEAARLLAAAQPAATLLSRDVAELASLPLTEDHDLGPLPLKGLSEPVHVILVEHGRTAPPLLDLPPAFERDERFTLVGRTTPLAQIERAWDHTLGGVAGAVLISGEEGIGKTRLVREHACVIHETGGIVLYGACDEDLRGPYLPIVQALGRAADLDSLVDAAIRDGSGPLGVLLGAAARTDLDAAAPGQLALYDAVADAFRRLTTARPVLLVIDDIQWAALDTIRLLEHLMGSLGSSRLMIVATCRAEALAEAKAGKEFLGIGGNGARVEHVRLDRLPAADVIAMLESRTAAPLTDAELDLATQICSITGGSPLYVEELTVHLADSQVLVSNDAGRWSIGRDVATVSVPESVIDLMWRRFSRLGSDTCDTLTVAALIGATFDVEVLADVVGVSLEIVLDAIESAANARLTTDVDRDGLVTFGDEVSRAALLRQIRPGRRATLHKDIALTLERLRPNRVDELITHWSGALGREARSKAVHYLRLASSRDMAASAWESTVVRERQILQLLEVDGVEDAGLLGETRLQLGVALRLLGEESYISELTVAAAAARSAGDPQLLFRAAAAMMRPGEWTPEAGVVDSDIVAMCEDTLLLLDDDDPLRPRVLAALATNLAYDTDPDRRTALVVEAQKLARATGDLGLIGTTLVAELLTRYEPELFARRRTVADEVRRIGRATADNDLLFTGSWFVMQDLFELGETAEALVLLEELQQLAAAKRDFFSRYRVDYVTSAVAVGRRDDQAADKLELVRTTFEDDPVDSFAVWVIQWGMLALYAGTLSEVLVPIAEAADMWDESWSQRWDFALAKAYLDTGDHEAALRTVRANPEPDTDPFWLSSYLQLAQVGLLLDLPDICERIIERLTPFRGRLVLVGACIAMAGPAAIGLGQANLGLGNLEQAEVLFREAIAQAERAELPYFATNARRMLAQTLITRRPDDAEGPQLLQRVLEDAAQHEFAMERREAEAMLARASAER